MTSSHTSAPGCELVAKSQETARQATGRARRADQQQRLAPQLVDHAHAHDGEDQIGEADGDGLLVAGDLAEAGRGEDAVQVIEDGVDAGQLVECADGDGQKQRVAVLPAEDRLVGRGVLLGQRGADVGQFAFGVRLAHQLEHGQGFVDAVLRGRPARAARNAEEQRQESQRRAARPRPPASATPPRPDAACG